MTQNHVGVLSASFSGSSKYYLRNHKVNLKATCLPVPNPIPKRWRRCHSSAQQRFFAVALSTLCWHMEKLRVYFCAWDLWERHSESDAWLTLPQFPALSRGAHWARHGQIPLPRVGCRDPGSLRFARWWPCCGSTFSSRLLQFVTEVVSGAQHPSPRATPCSWASGPTGSSFCSRGYPEVRSSPATSQNDWPLLRRGHEGWSCALPTEGQLPRRAAVSLGTGGVRRPL